MKKNILKIATSSALVATMAFGGVVVPTFAAENETGNVGKSVTREETVLGEGFDDNWGENDMSQAREWAKAQFKALGKDPNNFLAIQIMRHPKAVKRYVDLVIKYYTENPEADM